VLSDAKTLVKVMHRKSTL